MITSKPSSLFSKLITVVLVFGCLGGAFWVGQQLLEPVPVPLPPPPKTQVNFDPKADVSKHSVFNRLQPIGPANVEAGKLGKSNPFAMYVSNSAPLNDLREQPATTTGIEADAPVVPAPVEAVPQPRSPELISEETFEPLSNTPR